MKSILDIIVSIISSLNENGIFSLTTAVLTLLLLKKYSDYFKEDLQLRRNEFNKTNRHFEKSIQNTIELQNQASRIQIMPYLEMNKDVLTSNHDDGHIILNPKFKNVGNGTAVGLKGKYLNDTLLLCDTLLAEYRCYSPFNSESSVVRKDGQANFEIIQVLKDKEIDDKVDKIHFKIQYNDLMRNQYEQEFTILVNFFDINNVAEIVESFPPELLDNSET